MDWGPPDDEVFVAITDLMRSAGTYLYGRRMYEALAVWGGKPALSADTHAELALLDEHRFGNGVVHLHHRVL